MKVLENQIIEHELKNLFDTKRFNLIIRKAKYFPLSSIQVF